MRFTGRCYLVYSVEGTAAVFNYKLIHEGVRLIFDDNRYMFATEMSASPGFYLADT